MLTEPPGLRKAAPAPPVQFPKEEAERTRAGARAKSSRPPEAFFPPVVPILGSKASVLIKSGTQPCIVM